MSADEIGSAEELNELVRLRATLTWADWKEHPRFKRDRVLREAQRRWGVQPESVQHVTHHRGTEP